MTVWRALILGEVLLAPVLPDRPLETVRMHGLACHQQTACMCLLNPDWHLGFCRANTLLARFCCCQLELQRLNVHSDSYPRVSMFACMFVHVTASLTIIVCKTVLLSMACILESCMPRSSVACPPVHTVVGQMQSDVTLAFSVCCGLGSTVDKPPSIRDFFGIAQCCSTKNTQRFGTFCIQRIMLTLSAPIVWYSSCNA